MIKEIYLLIKEYMNLKVADIASKQDNHINNQKQSFQLTKTKKVDTKSSLEGSKRKRTN